MRSPGDGSPDVAPEGRHAPGEDHENGHEREHGPYPGAAHGARPGGPYARRSDREALAEAFFAAARRLGVHLTDLRADLERVARARKDRVQLRARELGFQLAMLCVVGIVGLVVLVASAWLAMEGLAGAVSDLTDVAWLGPLLVGVLVPVGALCVLGLARWRGDRRRLRELMEEYRDLERRRQAARGPDPAREPARGEDPLRQEEPVR